MFVLEFRSHCCFLKWWKFGEKLYVYYFFLKKKERVRKKRKNKIGESKRKRAVSCNARA